jgi:hypothetical protein
MKFCYLCHDQLNIGISGAISYNATSDVATTLYACPQCVNNLGVDQAFDLLEEHYEHRASLRDTLTHIDISEIRRQVYTGSED